MNKSDLIVALAKEADLTQRKSEEIVNLVFDTMASALVSGDRIEIRGFGSLMVKKYGAYTGRNPKSGTRIEVEEKKLPFFKTGKELRERVQQAGR
ncbi:MAG: integration host factor subunit beta [Desulfomonile sp.]|nr:integration host factor subunit beta [Desulfomonile sp.]